METTPNQRLGQLVELRRKQLGLTLDDVQDAGGPSDVTTSKVEKGLVGAVSAGTLRKLDVGLRWNSGSAARTMAGGEPLPLEALPQQQQEGTTTGTIEVSLSDLNQLVELVKKYGTLEIEGAEGEQLRILNDELAEAVAGCVHKWVSQRLDAFPAPAEGANARSIVSLIRG